MRVLIYGETKAAQERRGAEIAAGNTASLRNPGLFLASELEPCGLALADDPAIIATYKARKIPTGPIAKPAQAVIAADVEAEDDAAVDAPKLRLGRRGAR